MAKDTTRVRRKERKNIANAVAHVNSLLVVLWHDGL